MPDEDPPSTAPKPGGEDLGALVRRALLEIGEMKDIQERMKAVSDRISKVTPPPTVREPSEEPPPAAEREPGAGEAKE